jgi:hypothetical protein
MKIDRGANMVMPTYIDEILNEVQYGNDEKSFSAWKRLKQDSSVFDI